MVTVFKELPPVFFIRHGQDEDQKNRHDTNRNLARTGMEQAMLVGDYLRSVQKLGANTVVLCADLKRTTQTAQIISEELGSKDEVSNPYISSALTEFGKLKYHKMDKIIAEVTECCGDFRGFLVKELLRLNPGDELRPGEPIPVVTQRPVIARVMGLDPKELPYACVYQYPPPGGIAVNLVESLIN